MHPDVWIASWDDVQVIMRSGRRARPKPVWTFTVARTKDHAIAMMRAGLLGFADIEGAATEPTSIRRMKSPGFAGGYPDAIADLLTKGYRFVFPSECFRYRYTDMGKIVNSLILALANKW